MAKSLTYGQGPYMSLGYSGLGPNCFLNTMSKHILQVETEISWSGTKQFLQERSWSVNQVDLGQVDQDDDV